MVLCKYLHRLKASGCAQHINMKISFLSHKLTGTVLCILLILRMEIMYSIGHYILGVHGFLKRTQHKRIQLNVKYINKKIMVCNTFKLLEIDCIVTERP